MKCGVEGLVFILVFFVVEGRNWGIKDNDEKKENNKITVIV